MWVAKHSSVIYETADNCLLAKFIIFKLVTETTYSFAQVKRSKVRLCYRVLECIRVQRASFRSTNSVSSLLTPKNGGIGRGRFIVKNVNEPAMGD